MWDVGIESNWSRLAEGVMLEIREWREMHPKATFTDIEEAVDRLMAKARAQFIQDVALASEARNIRRESAANRPRRPGCGSRLESRGEAVRRLSTSHAQPVEVRRSRGVCPACGAGFSPLDEELGLLPGTLTPSLAEDAALLGSLVPFTPAAELIGRSRKVEVSEATVRRVSENSGQAWVELQREEAEALELEEAPEGPALQQLSVDGAMVPLLHGEWAEVKTLVIGTIEEPGLTGEVHAQDLSYFSRMLDQQSFGRLATVETHRRGTERAGTVCAVVDGAEWQQKFIDLHCPDAVRILHWCHAAEYLSKAGQAAFGAGTAEANEWLGIQLHQLKHGEPEEVLRSLRGLCLELAGGGEKGSEALQTVKRSMEYLKKRKGQIRYAEFQAQGYPIGSGAVESANKLVVEARLKGSGMHWARAHVDPMLALRTVVCSDRWEEARERRLGRWVRSRRPEGLEAKTDSRAQTRQRPPSAVKRPRKRARAIHSQAPNPRTSPHRIPPANHPWRRMAIGRKCLSPNHPQPPHAKT